jgi:hypothetical protein
MRPSRLGRTLIRPLWFWEVLLANVYSPGSQSSSSGISTGMASLLMLSSSQSLRAGSGPDTGGLSRNRQSINRTAWLANTQDSRVWEQRFLLCSVSLMFVRPNMADLRQRVSPRPRGGPTTHKHLRQNFPSHSFAVLTPHKASYRHSQAYVLDIVRLGVNRKLPKCLPPPE